MRLLVIVLLSAAVPAGAAWQGRADGGILGFEVEPRKETVAAAGRTYVVLKLDGAGMAGEPGSPQIPVFRRLVEIPFGAEVEVEATAGEVSRLTLAHPLYPRQYPVPKSGPEPEFALDHKAYEADRFRPELGARVAATGIARGHRLALVEVFPVSYNPVRQEAMVAARMEVRVRWTGADWDETRSRRERYDSKPFAGRLDGIAEILDPVGGALPELPVGYLVIVPDEWQENIAPLAEWRRQKGFNVTVSTLSQAGGSATSVKAFIQDAYDNWPVPPSFVMLIGDVDKIGCFNGQGTGSPSTDLDYALVEGDDYLPDIDVSRASVASAAQLDSLVEKILSYEQNVLAAGQDWLGKAYFIASADNRHHQVPEATHAHVMAKLRQRGTDCDSLWLYYRQGTPINSALNSGRGWVTYSGHGSENSWADPSPAYTVANVHSLANEGMIPYVQTYACDCGDFASYSSPECFSEAWIRSGRRGGIAHVASSVTSYWTEDDTLERRVFDCMYDSSFFWAMGGFNRAKIAFYGQMGDDGVTRRYFEMYNLMGDGAIDVFSRPPDSLEVSHPLTVPVGGSFLPVDVRVGGQPISDVLVCATAVRDSAVHAAGYTDVNGQALLELQTTALDTLFVTCTGHDRRPYFGLALVLPASGPWVLWSSFAVDDSAGGNNDRIVNPGETINLRMWLRNWGSGQAEGVWTRLRSSDPNVTILDSLKSFGSIAAGDSAYSGPAGFRFAVAPACTNGCRLRFAVSSTDASDSSWQSPLLLSVGAPRLEYSGCVADDPGPGGNHNRRLDPGEQADLVVTLRNTGQGVGHGVTAVLRSGDARLAVLDSSGGFGDIGPDTLGDNRFDRFRVSADVSIPAETRVPCTLFVRTGTLESSMPISLDIGVTRTCDPIPDGPRTPPRYYAYDATDTLYDQAPVFSWVEISGLGTRLDLDDDETRILELPAGFGPWRFYGRRYERISVCSNGWVAPGDFSYAGYFNTALPNNSVPPMVCASWDDYDPQQGGGVWWLFDSTGRRFIVEYDSVHYRAASSWDRFQVIIHDTASCGPLGDNEIVVQYATANGYDGNTVGLQDPTTLIAIQCLFNGDYHLGAAPIAAGMAVKYTAAPPTGIKQPEPGEDSHRAVAFASPNPFRVSTAISLQLTAGSPSELRIYDAAGRLVRTLAKGRKPTAASVLVWDGRDSRGRRCGHGVYFYRFESGSGARSGKVVLLD